MPNLGSPRDPRSGARPPRDRTRVVERSARGPRRRDAGRDRAVGALLLALCAIFLLFKLVPLEVAAPLWPLALIVPGALLVLVAAVPGRGLGMLAVPGSVAATLGLILGLQELTGRYDTWAYAWGLIPVSIGLGLMVQGAIAHHPEQRRDGARLASIGAALFVGFGLYVEVMVFRGWVGSWLLQVVGPVLLIVAGLALVFLRASRGRAGRRLADGERPGPRRG